MTIYVIGYDLHPTSGETEKDYANLMSAIKAIAGGDWWHCLDSTWLVPSNQTAVQIRDQLLPHIHRDDQLLVVAYAPHESAWYGFSGDCQTWLRSHM